MSKKWEPYVCMMTNSTCYKNTQKMKIVGVLWHDTGCDNTWLSRYVQPLEGQPNYAEAIAKLGKNRYGNDWNHINKQAGLNCWVGKFADGSVGTVQTMPWDFRPWGCGSGKNGSCNTGWIQFEICEDARNDKEYAQKVYDEAVQLTAWLCKEYGIDPHGTVEYRGQTVPTILCHWDSYLLGLGSGHGDIYDWFPKTLGKCLNKTMADARDDIATAMAEPIIGWQKEGNYWYYYNEDGSKAVGWKKIDNIWYYFNTEGQMQTGWIDINGSKYYMKKSGAMHEGWLKYEGKWYYLNPNSGVMQVGWKKVVNDAWYFFHDDGSMASKEWAKYQDGYEYWLSKNGKWTYQYKGHWINDLKGKKFQDEAGWIPANEKVIIDSVICEFDADGYVIKETPINPVETNFKVRITADSLNIRSGPGTEYEITGSIDKGGSYTIVEVKENWGRLKSDAGWICLDYTERIN